jgi:hypothetical protein
VHVAVHRDVRPIVLQPWEGLTALALYRIFSRRRSYLQIPTWAAKAAVGLGTSIPWPELDGLARRTELLLVGQRQEANVLTELKFRIPVGREGWERLARDLQIRGRARRFTAS